MAQTNSGKIGLFTATITGMNAMIGSGIFVAPAMLASNVGPAGILTYVFVIFSVWLIAQSIARVAEMFPTEGSFYTYAKQWGGHIVGLFAGLSYIIGLSVAMGLLCAYAGRHLAHFFPGVSDYTLGLLALSALVILNIFGAVLSQLGQQILICCTVFPLITIIVMCFSKADTSLLTPFAPYGIKGVLSASRIAIFGFFGFESAASLFNIVKNPKRNVPRALTYSLLLVGSLYLLFITAIVLAVPLSLFVSPTTPISETLAHVFPNTPWLITVIHVSILSAILGTIHSVIWGCSNLFFSLIKKIKSPAIKKLVDTKKITNKTSVLLVGLCMLISYSTISNVNLFFSFAYIFLVIAYVSAMIPLLTIKKEWTSGRNIMTVLGIVTATVILLFTLQDLFQSL